MSNHVYTVKEVAELLGRSPGTVRAGLKMGIYPFGCAIKKPGAKVTTFVFYPKKVEEYLGNLEDN